MLIYNLISKIMLFGQKIATSVIVGVVVSRGTNLHPCTSFVVKSGSIAAAHKGLNSPKRFTNLLMESMSLILNIWVPWSPSDPKSSRDALIEVFKFIRYV